MATIKAIEGRSVHQIQSGQVIVDLNSVVKELVENSLDASATNIEVRLRNHGLEAIEVQDNGKGIAPEDFDSVALKHHTSKLSSYEDLSTLDTFGFRGEALSSLCALSKFHILTARAQDGALGKRLNFDMAGKLKSNTPVAAQKGTAVFVEDIFFNLPVRRKELEKNIKREYGKVIGLLYAYACISVGVRFSVTNHMPKGKKTLVFSTKTNTTTKENIINVFGAKTTLALTTLDLHLQMAPNSGPSTQGACIRLAQAPKDRSLEVHVQGHISKPVFGEGRQAPDRQMFFVNSRPCQLPQVSKAINDVYKSFNVSQSPFIFANLVMDTTAYDVNVSPDKRTIMLHDQTALLESLKTTLSELFERTDHTVPHSTLPNRKTPNHSPLTIIRRESTTGSGSTIAKEESSNSGDESEAEDAISDDGQLDLQPAALASNLIQEWVGRDTVPRIQAAKKRIMSGELGRDKQRLVSNLKENMEAAPAVPRKMQFLTAADEQESDGDMSSQEKSLEITNESSATSVESAPVESLAAQDVQQADKDVPSATSAECLTPLKTTPGQSKKPSASLPNVTPKGVHNHDLLNTPYDNMSSPRIPMVEPAPKTMNTPDPAMEIETEAPIPAVTPGSHKLPPGPIQNAFDRMRPKRTPIQTAEITIGDVTTTAVIGSGQLYKKRRIHKPDNSQAVANYGASPSLAHSLRKSFAAPGSQLEFVSSSLPSSTIESENMNVTSDDESADESTLSDTPSPPNSGHNALISTAVEDLVPKLANDDDWNEEYLDDEKKKAREEEKVAALILEAEEAAARPTEASLKRANTVLRNGGDRKDAVLRLNKVVNTSMADIEKLVSVVGVGFEPSGRVEADEAGGIVKGRLDDDEAESRLSLTITKFDFGRMHIIGQFNLGFILAVRPAAGSDEEDDLFIIDQHAADEKFNYERLQSMITLQSQRLVHPKDLDLTATQEEVILNHADALKANGFEIESTASFTPIDSDDEYESTAVRRKLRLLTLPMSKEKTFDLSDLEELLHLLSEQPAGSTEIPRPKKVQKLLAMRACRSSIMVGKTLTLKQMEKVVCHMGEMDKPWNCPHGRPTMRHLAGLKDWCGWKEGELLQEDERDGCMAQAERTDWNAFLEKRK